MRLLGLGTPRCAARPQQTKTKTGRRNDAAAQQKDRAKNRATGRFAALISHRDSDSEIQSRDFERRGFAHQQNTNECRNADYYRLRLSNIA